MFRNRLRKLSARLSQANNKREKAKYRRDKRESISAKKELHEQEALERSEEKIAETHRICYHRLNWLRSERIGERMR